jgi:hypothetical protein
MVRLYPPIVSRIVYGKKNTPPPLRKKLLETKRSVSLQKRIMKISQSFNHGSNKGNAYNGE